MLSISSGATQEENPPRKIIQKENKAELKWFLTYGRTICLNFTKMSVLYI